MCTIGYWSIHFFIVLALWNNHLIWVLPIKIQEKRSRLLSNISLPICPNKFDDLWLSNHLRTIPILFLHYIQWKIMSVIIINLLLFTTNMSYQISVVHLWLYVGKNVFFAGENEFNLSFVECTFGNGQWWSWNKKSFIRLRNWSITNEIW